jgi:hypothetical protein
MHILNYRLKIKKKLGSDAVDLVRQTLSRAVDEGGASSRGRGRRNARWRWMRSTRKRSRCG